MATRWLPANGEQVRHPHGVGVVRRVTRRQRGDYEAEVFTGTRTNGAEVLMWFRVADLKAITP